MIEITIEVGNASEEYIKKLVLEYAELAEKIKKEHSVEIHCTLRTTLRN